MPIPVTTPPFLAVAVGPRTSYEKACDGGNALGCHNLGVLYATGEGVPQDFVRAASLFERACVGGDADGCLTLGRMYYNGVGLAQNHTRSAALFERACAGGVVEACR